jgi:putative transposase
VLLRLPPMSDTDKSIEILTLRHQLAILQRQIDKPRLAAADRAFLAALLHRLPRLHLRQLHLIVSPDTVLRWHRDLLRRRHAKSSRPKRPGRPRTRRSIQALVLRLARENSSWGYRRIHGELAVLGIAVAPSTVWEFLKTNGVEPAAERDRQTWAAFLRSQAHVKYLIRDRDSRYTAAFDAVFEDEGAAITRTGVRVPRMNAIMERWVRSCRAELLDRTLIVNRAHLLHAVREYETFYNRHRTHRALHAAAPRTPASPTDQRNGPTRPHCHPTTRSTRRYPPRVPTRRLSCTDEVFGTDTACSSDSPALSPPMMATDIRSCFIIGLRGSPLTPLFRWVTGSS